MIWPPLHWPLCYQSWVFHHDQVEKCTYFESERERRKKEGSYSTWRLKSKESIFPLLFSAFSSSSSLYLLTSKSSVWHSCVIQYKCQGYNESTRYERPLLLFAWSLVSALLLATEPADAAAAAPVADDADADMAGHKCATWEGEVSLCRSATIALTTCEMVIDVLKKSQMQIQMERWRSRFGAQMQNAIDSRTLPVDAASAAK